ncbi:hypothetical protein SAMN05421734_11430 [Pelagirhabdus alkalitolerans]|uniref:Uncharacterized protein n=1 Tax=Pelagirhabdus alkalitolerans TaxID=1612202 RepID=A0A1G6N6Z9_9BACI|nr:hypothetical protein [Pelagirhabdus alkalitolerans]SDC63026.1 hypothetical protein SAMN05421734_11430 [Pelagirhabdus alkalitolerans]
MRILIIIAIVILAIRLDYKRFSGRDRKAFLIALSLATLYIIRAHNDTVWFNYVEWMDRLIDPISSHIDRWLMRYRS